MAFLESAMNRDKLIQRLGVGSTPWDILVVGGGATGLGVAVDAAARGYRTALLEQGDFAEATTSRSTKLIHGGLRYLQQAQFSLVREALQERQRLLRNAPHLVHPVAFLLPYYRWWERAYYGSGVGLYDRLAGTFLTDRSRHLSRSACLEQMPNLQPKGLRGAVAFHDAQFDDSRMAVALARTAVDLDAVVVNRVRVIRLLKRAGRVCGVRAINVESGGEFEVPARAVVNATGVFVDEFRQLDDATAVKLLTFSQGTHVTVDAAFLTGPSALIRPRQQDGRVFFAIPWMGRTLLGTTETPAQAPARQPRPLPQEIEELLHESGRLLVRSPEQKDVLSAFAGIRPLVRRSKHRVESYLSRAHLVEVSSGGLVTVTGGKWTTYRKMAEDAVEQAANVGSLPARPAGTANLRLHGGDQQTNPHAFFAGYGADADAVQDLCTHIPNGMQLLHPALPYRTGEVVWAARHEMARSLEDVLSRRTRCLLLDARASMLIAAPVARLLAAELGRDSDWANLQVNEFNRLARTYLPC